MARTSLSLRQDIGGSALRPPAGSTEFNSALRSDFAYLPDEMAIEQIGIVVEDLNREAARVSFDPSAIPQRPEFVGNEAPLEAVLMRSTAGTPLTSLDGEMMRRIDMADLDQFNDGWVRTIDSPLVGGVFVYYALFAKYVSSGNTYWIKVGTAYHLPAIDYYSSTEWVWKQMPTYYRKLDIDAPAGSDLLKTSCQAMAYELDVARTWAFTLGDLWDMSRTFEQLLPAVSGALGLTPEIAAGGKRARALLTQLVALRKMKGTKDGIEGYLTALSGYRTLVYDGMNKMGDNQHTEFSQAWTTAQNPVTGVLPGWNGGSTGFTIERVISAVTTTYSPPTGTPFMRVNNASGGAATTGASYGLGFDIRNAIPVKPGHSYRFAASFVASTGTPTLQLTAGFYTAAGGFISAQTPSLGAISTTWSRLNTPSFTAPALAAFMAINVSTTTTIANGASFSLWRPMVVDLAWRPQGLPYRQGDVPLSSNVAAITDFTSEDYYEPPRHIYINSYPQRLNLARNSAFALAGSTPSVSTAWSLSDAPTYASIPLAYNTYTAIAAGEDDYADLAAELDPLAGAGTLTIGSNLATLAVAVAPFQSAMRSDWFPVLSETGGMSARITANANIADVKLVMRVQWYFDDATGQEVLDGTGNPIIDSSDTYTLTSAQTDYTISGAYPPAGAAFGRLSLEITAPAAASVEFRRALIEDKPLPGPYFDGTWTDGDFGDFFFVNGAAAHTKPSAYYMAFRSFLSNPGGQDRIKSVLAELLPSGVVAKVTTAAGDLLG